MKYLFVNVVIVFLCISCNLRKNENPVTVLQNNDSIKIPFTDDDSLFINTDTSLILSVDDDFYLTTLKAKDTVSDYSFYKLDEFTRRKDGNTHFRYYILKELNFSENFRTYLIAEDYESEMACWLVTYGENDSLLDFREVYYDNAEGFAWTHSKMDTINKTIEIIEGNIYKNPEEEVIDLKIDDNGKFINTNIPKD